MRPLVPFLDRRAEVGDAPGLHALIVGVSEYRYLPPVGSPAADVARKFGMTRLTSPAMSAVRIWHWLVERGDKLTAKLATCRLLLSASPTEIARFPELEQFPQGALFESFATAAEAWREDARRRADEVTLFYFAGHGVQEPNTDDVVLLLEDFSGPGAVLRNGVRASEIQSGMAPIEAAIGLHALFDGLIRNWILSEGGFDLVGVGGACTDAFLLGLGLSLPVSSGAEVCSLPS